MVCTEEGALWPGEWCSPAPLPRSAGKLGSKSSVFCQVSSTRGDGSDGSHAHTCAMTTRQANAGGTSLLMESPCEGTVLILSGGCLPQDPVVCQVCATRSNSSWSPQGKTVEMYTQTLNMEWYKVGHAFGHKHIHTGLARQGSWSGEESGLQPEACWLDIQGKACIAVMAVADREALGMESPRGVSLLPTS